MKKPTVLLLLPYPATSFMQRDEAILRSAFSTTTYIYPGSRLKLVTDLLRMIIAGKADIVVCWFIMPNYALVVASLAKLLWRRVVFIAGGLDVDWVQSLNYGAMASPRARQRFLPTLKRSDLILAFSDFSAVRIAHWASYRPAGLHTLYFEVDSNYFQPPSDLSQKERLAVTVCYTINSDTAAQKGVDTFVQAAATLPDVQFVVVGKMEATAVSLQAIASSNVQFVGRISDLELLALYQRAGAYVQLSAHEGFGVAVAEAMACGCIPVITDPASYQTSMPEVVGECGYQAAFGDVQALAVAVRLAVEAAPAQRQAARQRIVEWFAPGTRQQAMINWLRQLDPQKAEEKK